MQRTLSRIVTSAMNRRGVRVMPVRAFASAAPVAKGQSSKAEFDLGKLVKPLQAEIEFHREFIGDQKLSVGAVTKKHAKLLEQNEWTLNCQEGSTEVTLETQRGDMKVVVRFDAEMVAESVNAGIEGEDVDEVKDEEEEEEEFEDEEEDDDFYDEDEMGAQPYNFTVELHRPDVLAESFVEMELEAVPQEGPSGDSLYVSSISVRSRDETKSRTAYAGPTFDSLDERLRDQFEGWAQRNLRHLLPVIGELSQAKEAQEYGQWLETMKMLAKK